MILPNPLPLSCYIHPRKGTAAGISPVQALTALGAPGVSVFPVRNNMETGVESVILLWSDHILPTSITSNLKLRV